MDLQAYLGESYFETADLLKKPYTDAISFLDDIVESTEDPIHSAKCFEYLLNNNFTKFKELLTKLGEIKKMEPKVIKAISTPYFKLAKL